MSEVPLYSVPATLRAPPPRRQAILAPRVQKYEAMRRGPPWSSPARDHLMYRGYSISRTHIDRTKVICS